MIDIEKFNELNINIFKALDEDNIGLVNRTFLKDFTENFLEGTQYPGQPNSSFTGKHDHVFKILDQFDSGVLGEDDVGMFMRALIKSQA